MRPAVRNSPPQVQTWEDLPLNEVQTIAIARELGLTWRQAAVAALVRRGDSDKKIADGLGISKGTVRKHLAAAMAALGVLTRVRVGVLFERAAGWHK
jgi:DNA-binding NarL/FixJ family response regulator